MTKIELGSEAQWSLSPLVGIEHPFFMLNVSTIVYTWAMIAILCILIIIARLALKKNYPLIRFVVLTGIESLMTMTTQALGPFYFNHFSFIGALFIFIVLCNMLAVFPWLDEPTKDLNTTLALGITSFLYVQYADIKHNGIGGYIKEYFSPFFLMFPINLVGKVASIISISFRLFGNIFGGSMISGMFFSAINGNILFETVAMLLGFNLILTLFFTLFEGFLQAFVFAMLSLTYLSIALQGEGH